MKSALHKAVHVVRVVVHDPAVDRAGKKLAVLIAVRLLIAAGASAQVVDIARHFWT